MMQGSSTYGGLLADAAALVSAWREGAVRCFDGDTALMNELNARRERIFSSLRDALEGAEDLRDRCELLSGMFAVTLDASSVPDPGKEETCRELAERTLHSPECGEYLRMALAAEAVEDESGTVAAVRRLAEDLAWPDEL